MRTFEDFKIAVAGTGYVGLSMATLLSQNHQVTAVDVIPEKVDKINKIDDEGTRVHLKLKLMADIINELSKN